MQASQNMSARDMFSKFSPETMLICAYPLEKPISDTELRKLGSICKNRWCPPCDEMRVRNKGWCLTLGCD